MGNTFENGNSAEEQGKEIDLSASGGNLLVSPKKWTIRKGHIRPRVYRPGPRWALIIST